MSSIVLFESKNVRRFWNEKEQKWYFAIVDVVSVLTDSIDPGAYWRKLKERLKKEGNETVTNCHALKMVAAQGFPQMRITRSFPRSDVKRLNRIKILNKHE